MCARKWTILLFRPILEKRAVIIMRVLLLLLIVAIAATLAHAECGTACPYGNNDCKDPDCPRCNGPGGFGGVCVKGFQCNETCVSDTDCDQSNGTICTQCWQKRCSAPCGGKCTKDSQCGAPGCGACIGNHCTLSSCGQACSGDSDCRWGSCLKCGENKRCVSQCGTFCHRHQDCPATCPKCTSNICIKNVTTEAPTDAVRMGH